MRVPANACSWHGWRQRRSGWLSWWWRATREGAVAGLVTGLALWSFSAWGGWYGGKEWIEKWLPVGGHSLLVAPVVFVVVAAVSLVTQPTSGVGPFLDRIHGGRFGARP
jgi:Na+/proline symporter